MKRVITISAALALLTANFFSGSAAFAHDEVVSTLPADGSTVESGVVELGIEFGEDILVTDGNQGLDIVVTDAKGVAQQIGCLGPEGKSLTARVAIAKAGDYKVTWRSVSSDGHPNEGSYTFKTTTDAPADFDPAAVDACPRLLIATPLAANTASDATANSNTPTEIAVLVLGLLVIAGAAVWVTSSRKRKKN